MISLIKQSLSDNWSDNSALQLYHIVLIHDDHEMILVGRYCFVFYYLVVLIKYVLYFLMFDDDFYNVS